MTMFTSLAHEIAERRAKGLDTFDEWWDGEYRIVTGPRPAHGEMLARLGVFLLPLADGRGLRVATTVNIGLDKRDCRVPDIGVYRPDTPLTSPAFLATAELVVEVLSPGEKPQEKLDFYAHWHVDEYLELDLRAGTAVLLRRTDTTWDEVGTSGVLGFGIEPGALVASATRLTVPTEESP